MAEAIRDKGYPNAILFEVSFPIGLATSALNHYTEQDFTPAFLVADNLLRDYPTNNFRKSLWECEPGLHGSNVDNPRLVQGYIDIVATFICSSYLQSTGGWGDVPIKSVFNVSNELAALPQQYRETAIQSVSQREPWVRPRIKASDAVDGLNIMPKLISKVISEGHDAAYTKGATIAYDTFMVFVEFLLIVLQKASNSASSASAATTAFCPHCGNKTPQEARFCPACGSNLGGEVRPKGTEYKEVQLPLDIKANRVGWSFDGAMSPGQEIEDVLNAKILASVRTMAMDGWEPDHPISFHELSRLHFVQAKDVSSAFRLNGGQAFQIESVKLRFKRLR